jgi:hypothetical protein
LPSSDQLGKPWFDSSSVISRDPGVPYDRPVGVKQCRREAACSELR